MRVLVQWSKRAPDDWVEVDSAEWWRLPFRDEPSATDRIDERDGWVHAVCVQGLVFDGYDHYAVEDLGSGLARVTCWNDDPDDWPAGSEWARVSTFRPYRQDPRFGGAVNTRISHRIFAGDDVIAAAQTAFSGVDRTIVRAWSAFVPPEEFSRNGIWVADDLHTIHRSARSTHGWREWPDGLQPADLDENGFVAVQRALGRYKVPDGTRTYYHTDIATAISGVAASFEGELNPSISGGATTQEVFGITDTGGLGWASITPTTEPNSAAWPAGTYRHQIDCVLADAEVTYGLLTQGGASGGFLRYDSASAVLETLPQVEGAFSGTGLKMATTSAAWTAGTDTDRFGFAIAAVRATGHGSKTMRVQVNEVDDFADGPWIPMVLAAPMVAAAVVASANAIGIKDPEQVERNQDLVVDLVWTGDLVTQQLHEDDLVVTLVEDEELQT